MKLLTRLLPLTAFAPMFALAQNANLGYFNNLLTSVQTLVNNLIPFVLALALLFFLWGVFVYFVFGAGDEGKRETGRAYMVYGIIGLVVMVAVWGIVQLVVTLLGVGGGATPAVPGIPR